MVIPFYILRFYFKNEKSLACRFFSIIVLSLFCKPLVAQQTPPDTVKTGIYITSIHDIDFKQKEYTIDSRFELSVGALFAVIGNKYIIKQQTNKFP